MAGEGFQSGPEAVLRAAGEEVSPRGAEPERLHRAGQRAAQTSVLSFNFCELPQLLVLILLTNTHNNNKKVT